MKKRKPKKIFKIFFIIILLIALSLCGYLTYKNLFLENETTNIPNKSNNEENKPIIEEPKEFIYTASILGTGDALAHTNVFYSALKDGGGKKYDFTYTFSKIKDIVSSYDIAYYNQETIFAGESFAYTGYPRFNTPSALGDYLIDTGFNVVSTATNHTLDKGEKGLLNALNYWKNTGVMFNGMAASEEERKDIMIMEANNIKYALLSYTTSTNGLRVPTGKSYLVNTYTQEKAKLDIDSIRDKVDVLMVAIHWGTEYTHNPNTFQKENAKYLAGLGVDIIFGAHPHVIQPMEKIDDTIVFYSLGNFISNQHELERKVGMFATMKVTKVVNESGTSVTINDVGAELTYVYNETGYKKHIVIPFSQMEKKYLSDYKNKYEKFKNILLRYDDSFLITPCAD